MYIRSYAILAFLSISLLPAQISQYPAIGGNGSTLYTSPEAYGSALVSDLANHASSQVIRIAVFGDSLSRCTASNCAQDGTFPTDGHVWPSLLRTYLNSKYTSHGTGIIPIRSTMDGSGSTEFDPVYFASATGSIAACNVGFQQLAPGIPGFQCYQMGPNAASLVSKSLTFDKLGFYYLSNFSLTGAGFTLTVDGSSVGTFGQENTGCCVGHDTYVNAPGGLGSHTFTITNPGSGVTFMYYIDAAIGTVGVSVDNLAMGGAKSEFYSKNNSEGAIGPINSTQLLLTQYSAVDTWYMVMLTTNDFLNVVSSQTDWYLNGLLSDLVTTNGVSPSKIILVQPPAASPLNSPNSGANDQAWFNHKVAQIASTWGVAFLNPSKYDKRFLSFQSQSDAGFMLNDGTHLNTAGQAAFFVAIQSALGLK